MNINGLEKGSMTCLSLFFRFDTDRGVEQEADQVAPVPISLNYTQLRAVYCFLSR